MTDLESAIVEQMEQARGDRATPKTAQGDIVETYHTGRIAAYRDVLEMLRRRKQAQARADQRARTDGGHHQK